MTRDQVINVVSGEDLENRINVQEAINLLLDDNKIFIVGRADTLALTNKEYEQFYFFNNNNPRALA